MEQVAPGIFTIDGEGSGAGLVLLEDMSEVAGAPYAADARSARHGDVVSIVATGLGQTMGSGPNTLTAFLRVLVDGIPAEIVSARAIGWGAYQVDTRIPEHATDSQAAPLYLQVIPPNGSIVQSNSVTIRLDRSAGR
jgi:uncharacterized protein (TIGR03437 family)